MAFNSAGVDVDVDVDEGVDVDVDEDVRTDGRTHGWTLQRSALPWQTLHLINQISPEFSRDDNLLINLCFISWHGIMKGAGVSLNVIFAIVVF